MGEYEPTLGDGLSASDLIAALEPELQDALSHPTRREILRVLHAGGPLSVSEVVAKLSPLSRGEVSYHARILEDSQCVTIDGSRPALDGQERLLRSTAGSDQAQLVLRATRRLDRRLRGGTTEAGSAGALTMFRIPRPGRTVRLRNHHRRGAERTG